MTNVDTVRGRIALIITTSAAMIEYGGMPLWVGVLIGHHGFDPKQAGSLVSIYLAGAVISGLIAAPIFGRLKSGKFIAVLGLFLGSLTFILLSKATGYMEMLVLHLIGGSCIGPVLAVSQGTTGRSSNPHRLFAMTALASSLCAAGFLAIMPTMVESYDGTLFFEVVAAVFAIGLIAAVVGFPYADKNITIKKLETTSSLPKIPKEAWFGLFGLACMAIVYSMTMSFVERVGTDRNYGIAIVSTVLTIMAIAKLFPPAIAGLLEKKLPIKYVLFIAPIIQALSCAAIFAVPNLIIYAIAAPIFITLLLFTQVFAFGLISRLEPSGRATALCPSIMMMGSMIGPFLGGSIVKAFNYPALAIAGCVIATLAIFFFSRVLAIRLPQNETTKITMKS